MDFKESQQKKQEDGISSILSGSAIEQSLVWLNAEFPIDVNDDGNLMSFIEVHENAYSPIDKIVLGSVTDCKSLKAEQEKALSPTLVTVRVLPL